MENKLRQFLKNPKTHLLIAILQIPRENIRYIPLKHNTSNNNLLLLFP